MFDALATEGAFLEALSCITSALPAAALQSIVCPWHVQLEKTMTQLENRLDKAIKRLNTRQAETRHAARQHRRPCARSAWRSTRRSQSWTASSAPSAKKLPACCTSASLKVWGADKVLSSCYTGQLRPLLSATNRQWSQQPMAAQHFQCMKTVVAMQPLQLFIGLPGKTHA